VRITLLTQHFAPHFEGGTEFVARSQGRALARRGHEVRVVSGTDRPHAGADVLRETVDGLPVAFLPRLPGESYDLELARPRIVELVEREARGSTVLHLHHWSTLAGNLVRALGETAPVVVTLHDLFTTCPRYFRVPIETVERCPEPGEFRTCARCCAPDAPGLSAQVLEAGLRERQRSYAAELARAAHVVVPSASHRDHLARFVDLPPERTSEVHHGLCARILPATGPVALPYTGGTLRVLHLGHRTEVKGLRDLARAVAGLAGVELLFLGEELQPGFDRELLREGGGTPMTFAGRYAVEQLARRVAGLGGAHLAVFPSRVAESYGLVLDEALALGLPVWVTDRGAPSERVGAAGSVLPAADPAAWRSAFSSVLLRPDTLERARRAVSGVRRTVDDAARDLEQLYRALLDRTPPTPSGDFR